MSTPATSSARPKKSKCSCWSDRIRWWAWSAWQSSSAFDEGIRTRKAIDAVLARRHVRIDIRMQCDNIEILKKMVEVGLGVSLSPRFSVQREVEDGVLRSLTVSDYSFKRPLALV